jgi:hypothetical protein
MTLTFRDSVTARLYLAFVFAMGTWIFGPLISLLLIFRHLDLDTYSLGTLMGLGLWIALITLALHFDWLGIQRMSEEKSLSVARIDFEPEYLRITGHKGWQLHYARQGMSLSKEALAARKGRTSYYLIIRGVEEKQEDAFFIGYDEEKANDIPAAFTKTGGSHRPGEAPAPGEEYFPLPAYPYHVATLFFSVIVVFFDVICLNGFSNPDWRDEGIRLAAFAVLAFLATTGLVWLIIKHLTRVTGIWITETCLRVGHAHGKTVEYPHTCYVFDKKRISFRGQSSFILQAWKNGKRIKNCRLGGDEERAMLEMIFRKLTTARQKALKAQIR